MNCLPSAEFTYVAPPRPETPYTIVRAEVSAYSSSVNETDEDPFITASGTRVNHDTLACPGRLEFGTMVEIEGKMYVCEDRMNRRYRDRENYDIWVVSKEVAYQFGRKNLDIRVYE